MAGEGAAERGRKHLVGSSFGRDSSNEDEKSRPSEHTHARGVRRKEDWMEPMQGIVYTFTLVGI